MLFFNRRRRLSTLFVLVAIGVMVRLGFWQLDRLEHRRLSNAAITAAQTAVPLALTPDALDWDPAELRFRRAAISGRYDPAHQIILKNQIYQGQVGIHLVTPLLIDDDSVAVLVDRGWIPFEESLFADYGRFLEPDPEHAIGLIRLSRTLPEAEITATLEPDAAWYRLDIAAIQAQMPYPLLPFYVQLLPTADDTRTYPYRNPPKFDLTEGPHMAYAIQWYLFAVVLGVGYSRFVVRAHKR